MKTSNDYRWQCKFLMAACAAMLVLIMGVSAFAQPTYVPGGTLDPTTVPKYVTPLVIPPVMPPSAASAPPVAELSMILPSGNFNSRSFPGASGGLLSRILKAVPP